jgi:glycosyltransferase involved in cell wall biosynthesis
VNQAWRDRHIVILNWRDLDHPQSGGAEVFAERIAERLSTSGARVTVVAARPKGLSRRSHRGGFTIIRFGGTFGVYLCALVWLAAHRRSVDAVIDCQNGIPFFSPLAVRRRTAVLQVIHHVHQRQFGLFFSPVAAAVGRQLEGRGSRAIYRRRPSVSVSPSTRREVREVLKLRGPRYLVTNGLELPRPEALATRSETPTIVCVGRLAAHKRIHLLLEAIPLIAEAIPNLRVHLIGDGPDEPRLHEIAESLSLPPEVLVWHGRVGAAERDGLVARGWLTVNPTIGEGWGIGVLEAASFGLPTLAFAVPGVRDSVRDGQTGWLIDEGGDLAEAVAAALRLLADPRVAKEYRSACLAWAAQFSWERSADLISTLLSAEHCWRQLGRCERRRVDDEGALVHLSAPATDLRLRATDVIFPANFGHSILLPGADAAGARNALKRANGSACPQSTTAIRIEPATEDDFLMAAVTGRSARAVG